MAVKGSLVLIVMIGLVLIYAYGPEMSKPSTNTTNVTVTQDNSTFILIGSFNMQIFGQSKINNPVAMKYLPMILSRYDIVALQEIRDEAGTSFPLLVKNMSDTYNISYNYVVSDRLGTTSSKEQYIFLYNPNKVTFKKSIQSGDTLFERPPFGAEFQAGNFTFIMIDIHTKPENTQSEMQAMNVAAGLTLAQFNTTNLIILGDMNADCTYFKRTPYILNNYKWLISDDMDTTVSNTDCAYDRIIISNSTDRYYINSGVDRYDIPLNVILEDQKQISDHYPVYARFKKNG